MRSFEKLNLFFDRIKTIGFWQRIFGWHRIRELSYYSYKEFKNLADLLDGTAKEAEEAKNSITVLTSNNKHLEEKIIDQGKELDLVKGQVGQLSNDAEKGLKICKGVCRNWKLEYATGD